MRTACVVRGVEFVGGARVLVAEPIAEPGRTLRCIDLLNVRGGFEPGDLAAVDEEPWCDQERCLPAAGIAPDAGSVIAARRAAG